MLRNWRVRRITVLMGVRTAGSAAARPLNLFAVGENPDDGADARLLEDLLVPEQQVSAAALGGVLEPAVDVLHKNVSLVRVEFLDRRIDGVGRLDGQENPHD